MLEVFPAARALHEEYAVGFNQHVCCHDLSGKFHDVRLKKRAHAAVVWVRRVHLSGYD